MLGLKIHTFGSRYMPLLYRIKTHTFSLREMPILYRIRTRTFSSRDTYVSHIEKKTTRLVLRGDMSLVYRIKTQTYILHVLFPIKTHTYCLREIPLSLYRIKRNMGLREVYNV